MPILSIRFVPDCFRLPRGLRMAAKDAGVDFIVNMAQNSARHDSKSQGGSETLAGRAPV